MHTAAPIPTENPVVMPTTEVPTSAPTGDPTPVPTSSPSFQPTTNRPTQSPLEYECTALDLQPCGNTTGRVLSFNRDTNQEQITSNYYETKLYTEQKGYNFVA